MKFLIFLFFSPPGSGFWIPWPDWIRIRNKVIYTKTRSWITLVIYRTLKICANNFRRRAVVWRRRRRTASSRIHRWESTGTRRTAENSTHSRRWPHKWLNLSLTETCTLFLGQYYGVLSFTYNKKNTVKLFDKKLSSSVFGRNLMCNFKISFGCKKIVSNLY